MEFSASWVRAAASGSQTRSNVLLAKHGRGKAVLGTWSSYYNPGSDQIPKLHMWVTKDHVLEGLAGCAGTGAASIHTFPPVSQLLTFTSFTLPGLVCSQRALNYTLISFGNWVTGMESGIRMAVTCRHKVLQFLPPRSPPAQSPSAKPHATGCWEKLLPDFTG